MWCDFPEPQKVCPVCPRPQKQPLGQMWSPLGSYLYTIHQEEVILYSGSNFDECGRLKHDGVKNILFSAQERYAITWDINQTAANTITVILWDVAAKHLLRKFSCTDNVNPPCAFSADEKYIATKGVNGIGMSMCVFLFSLDSHFPPSD